MDLTANIKHRRIKDAFLLGVRVFAPSLGGFLISLIIVNLYSKELWGTVVNISLWVFMFTSITSWGSKDYLLLSFSKETAKMGELFKKSFYTRLLLLPIFIIALFFIADNNWLLGCYASIWLLMRFVSTSFESLVVFHKQFGWMSFIEISGTILFIGLLFLFKESVNTTFIILLMGVIEFYKVVLLCIINRKIFQKQNTNYLDIKHLSFALPFFLMGMLGFLNSRTDQLLANLFLNNSDKALCQVYISLLVAAITLPTLVILPLVKNLYRAKEEVFGKVRLLMMKIGIIMAPIGASIIWLVVKYFYHFNVDILFLFAGIAYCFPAYIYIPVLYVGYKNEKQKKVLIIFLIGLVFVSVSGLVIIPIYASIGAIINAAFGQWFILALMLFLLMKSIDKNALPMDNIHSSPITAPENERITQTNSQIF